MLLEFFVSDNFWKYRINVVIDTNLCRSDVYMCQYY